MHVVTGVSSLRPPRGFKPFVGITTPQKVFERSTARCIGGVNPSHSTAGRSTARRKAGFVAAGKSSEPREGNLATLTQLEAGSPSWQEGTTWARALAVAGVLAAVAGAAHAAVDPDSVINMASSAIPDSVSSAVSSAVSPVAEKTSAFIPGLLGDNPIKEGIVSGFLLILFSELGDKTFFIAVLLAVKRNKGIVFGGTFGALAIMTVISVALGQVLHQIDELEFASSKLPLDDILAVALLTFFGVKTIQEARNADESAAEEREEAEEEVSKFDDGAAGLFLSTFALVFAAEWGDKSFLATIALAAASSPVGVVIGAVGGHGVATGIAVVGGSYLGKYVDEKVVQYVGGSLFLVFALTTVVDLIRGV